MPMVWWSDDCPVLEVFQVWILYFLLRTSTTFIIGFRMIKPIGEDWGSPMEMLILWGRRWWHHGLTIQALQVRSDMSGHWHQAGWGMQMAICLHSFDSWYYPTNYEGASTTRQSTLWKSHWAVILERLANSMRKPERHWVLWKQSLGKEYLCAEAEWCVCPLGMVWWTLLMQIGWGTCGWQSRSDLMICSQGEWLKFLSRCIKRFDFTANDILAESDMTVGVADRRAHWRTQCDSGGWRTHWENSTWLWRSRIWQQRSAQHDREGRGFGNCEAPCMILEVEDWRMRWWQWISKIGKHERTWPKQGSSEDQLVEEFGMTIEVSVRGWRAWQARRLKN